MSDPGKPLGPSKLPSGGPHVVKAGARPPAKPPAGAPKPASGDAPKKKLPLLWIGASAGVAALLLVVVLVVAKSGDPKPVPKEKPAEEAAPTAKSSPRKAATAEAPTVEQDAAGEKAVTEMIE